MRLPSLVHARELQKDKLKPWKWVISDGSSNAGKDRRFNFKMTHSLQSKPFPCSRAAHHLPKAKVDAGRVRQNRWIVVTNLLWEVKPGKASIHLWKSVGMQAIWLQGYMLHPASPTDVGIT